MVSLAVKIPLPSCFTYTEKSMLQNVFFTFLKEASHLESNLISSHVVALENEATLGGFFSTTTHLISWNILVTGKQDYLSRQIHEVQEPSDYKKPIHLSDLAFCLPTFISQFWKPPPPHPELLHLRWQNKRINSCTHIIKSTKKTHNFMEQNITELVSIITKFILSPDYKSNQETN